MQLGNPSLSVSPSVRRSSHHGSCLYHAIRACFVPGLHGLRGTDLRLQVDAHKLSLFVTDFHSFDCREVLEKSLLFYEAQRSGPLPSDNRIEWRGDSALEDVPVGGYYDGW